MHCALLDDEISTRRLKCYRIVPTTHMLREDENKKLVKCTIAWLKAQLRKNQNYRESIITYGTQNGKDYKMVKTNIRAMEDSEEKCRQFIRREKGIIIEDSGIREPLETLNVMSVKTTKRSTVGPKKLIKNNNDWNAKENYETDPMCLDLTHNNEAGKDEAIQQQQQQQQGEASPQENVAYKESGDDDDDKDQQPKCEREKKERQLAQELSKHQDDESLKVQPVVDEESGDRDDNDEQRKREREEKERQLAQELSKQQQQQQDDESLEVQPVVDEESSDDDDKDQQQLHERKRIKRELLKQQRYNDEEHKLRKQHKETEKKANRKRKRTPKRLSPVVDEVNDEQQTTDKKLKAIENKLDHVLEKQSVIQDIVKGTKKAVPPRKLLEEFLHTTQDGKKVIKIDEHTMTYDDALRIVNAKDMRDRFTLMLNTYMSIEEQAKHYIKLPKDKTEYEEAKIFKKTDS